jgi:HAMP domain-containing protein
MKIATRLFWYLLGITLPVGAVVYLGHPLFAAVAAVVLATLLAMRTRMLVSRPLQQLTQATVSFAAGNQSPTLPLPRNDEIGDLTIALSVMMRRSGPPKNQTGPSNAS